MTIDTQGVLLLGAVALIMLKLAGVLTWPWLVVLIPAFVLFFLWQRQTSGFSDNEE